MMATKGLVGAVSIVTLCSAPAVGRNMEFAVNDKVD